MRVHTYTNQELIEPLGQLIKYLEVTFNKHTRELADLGEPGPQTRLVKTHVDQRAEELRISLRQMASDHAEAYDWLKECERQPSGYTTLSTQDLRWLYRWRNQPLGGVK